MLQPSASRSEIDDASLRAFPRRLRSSAAARARRVALGRAAPNLIPLASTLIALAAMIAGGADPNRYFREGSVITWLNSAQIAACALIGSRLLAHYWSLQRGGKKTIFWLIVTLGAAYLAVDEVAQLHETSGPLVTWLRFKFGFGPALFIAGRRLLSIGDLFELSYGLAAVSLCLYYRHELAQHPRPLRLFWLGTALLLFSFGWDCLPFGDVHIGTLHMSEGLLVSVEDSAKFAGFGAMLGGFIIRLGEI